MRGWPDLAASPKLSRQLPAGPGSGGGGDLGLLEFEVPETPQIP